MMCICEGSPATARSSQSRHAAASAVMAWVAADRATKAVTRDGLPGDADRWARLRDEIHRDVCTYGWSDRRGAFTQEYGGSELDGALLMIPVVGFLPPEDDRVRSTVEAIESDLCRDGLVLRYRTDRADDGLPPGEGVFLPCSFWLADALALVGRTEDARSLFERLRGLANDVGLLSEEYDPATRRLLGNFPQAFSHIALVDTARNLSRPGGPADERRRR